MSSVITTYLQDHHAGSAAGVAAFRRVAEFHGDAAAERRPHQVATKSIRSLTAWMRQRPGCCQDH